MKNQSILIWSSLPKKSNIKWKKERREKQVRFVFWYKKTKKNPSSSLKINLNLIQLRKNYYMSFKKGCRLIVLRPEVPGYLRCHTQKQCKIIHQCEQKSCYCNWLKLLMKKKTVFIGWRSLSSSCRRFWLI
jgi:hypothetical protein